MAVPTIAGRAGYLASCLATCVAQDVDGLEILVSDNSDGDARDVVADLRDPRIRYVQPPAYLPMSSHWDFVLEQATGELITIIGDDDGLMPGSVSKVMDIHRETGPVPIHHALCNYFWPDYPRAADRNKVVFFHEPDRETRWIDSREYLDALSRGSARYVDGPMIYHNFIPLGIVRQLASGGLFFRRAIPDVYSAVAIAANTDRFFSIGECLTISGQGARATGAAVRSGGIEGRKFASEMDSSSLFAPRFRSKTIQLALVDAILEVERQFPSSSLGQKVDFEKHLWFALHEIPGMPNPRQRIAEVLEILKIAMQRRVLTRLSARVLGKGMHKVGRRITPGGAGHEVPVRRSGVFTGPLILDSTVRGIYDASLAVDAILKARSPAAAAQISPAN